MVKDLEQQWERRPVWWVEAPSDGWKGLWAPSVALAVTEKVYPPSGDKHGQDNCAIRPIPFLVLSNLCLLHEPSKYGCSRHWLSLKFI